MQNQIWLINSELVQHTIENLQFLIFSSLNRKAFGDDMKFIDRTIFTLNFFLCMTLAGSALANRFEEPMSFRVAMTGGNCGTCVWIAAEGIIEADSHEKFAAFAKKMVTAKVGFKSLEGVDIHLHSPGGSLSGGILLGQIFREHQVNTVVSASTTREILKDGEHVVNSDADALVGECSSACVFAFAGGIMRYALQDTLPEEVGFSKIGRIGVHQFYNPNAFKDPTAKIFSANDAIEDQKIVSWLLSYLDQMGVSSKLLQLASATKPTEMYYLTDADLALANLDTWAIKDLLVRGYKNGVATIELQFARKNAYYNIELFCENGQMKMLANVQWRGPYDIDGHKEWEFFKNISVKGLTSSEYFALELTEETFSNKDDKILGTFKFSFGDASLKSLSKLKKFQFEDGSGQWASDAASALNFSLPEDFHGLYLLPKACKN